MVDEFKRSKLLTATLPLVTRMFLLATNEAAMAISATRIATAESQRARRVARSASLRAWVFSSQRDEDCRDREPTGAACGEIIGVPAGFGFFLQRCIEDGGALGGFASARFGVLFGFPFRLGTTVGLLFFEAFFAGSAAFFNYGSQEIMDELVARVFAAADGGEQALVDQVFQAGTGRAWVPITRGAPIIGGARDLAPIGEDFKDASLVLLEARAAVAADKLFFDKDANGFRPPVETALVKGRDDGFDVGLAFVEGNLRGGLFGSAGCPVKRRSFSSRQRSERMGGTASISSSGTSSFSSATKCTMRLAVSSLTMGGRPVSALVSSLTSPR